MEGLNPGPPDYNTSALNNSVTLPRFFSILFFFILVACPLDNKLICNGKVVSFAVDCEQSVFSPQRSLARAEMYNRARPKKNIRKRKRLLAVYFRSCCLFCHAAFLVTQRVPTFLGVACIVNTTIFIYRGVGEKRCVTTQITAAKETSRYIMSIAKLTTTLPFCPVLYNVAPSHCSVFFSISNVMVLFPN